MAKQEQQPPGDGASDSADRRPLRVLVVDDNRDAADSLVALVKRWNHEVQWAYGGAKALEISATFHPDVLLLDIGMPQLDGCFVARQLRQKTGFEDTLLIAITGYSDEAHCRLCEEVGFDLYLVKPVEPSAVQNLLRLHHDRVTKSPEALQATPRPNGILVVDDEASVRGLLNAGMRQHGFVVWLAANGQAALDLYGQHRQEIDVILMDESLPGLDSPQTLAAIQQLNPQVRCCFLSGDLGNAIEGKLVNLGGAAILQKPFRLADVAHLVGELATRTYLKWP